MNTLIVMARVPGSAEAKTRLARDIGAEGAARVYEELLGLTLSVARAFAQRPACRAVVSAAGDLDDSDGVFDGLETWPQAEGDLGDRLRAGFERAFAEGDERVIAVGSDAPELDVALVDQAADALRSSDAVFGPAADGGYYLIGFTRGAWRSASGRAFAEIPWSSSTTAAVTLERLAEVGLSVAHLPVLADVDDGVDLAAWAKRWAT